MTGPSIPSETLLQAIALGSGGVAASDLSRLAAGVKELSRLFTKGRTTASGSYLDRPDLRAAYLQYYVPVNVAKVSSVLAELPQFGDGTPSHGPFRVLDVGAGPGTGSLAVLEWWSEERGCGPDLSVLAVDRSRKALALATGLWTAVTSTLPAGLATFQTAIIDAERPADLRRLAARQLASFDLILVVNSLNEWFRGDRDPVGRRVKILLTLLDMLDPCGSLVIVEPALREHTRALHSLRDRLLSLGCCSVYSPCLHEAPCPALAHPEDWCHEERGWQAPPIVAELDREVGFIKDSLKFSYLVLRKDGRTVVPRATDLVRVVSERRPFKGELRMWVCGEGGRRDIGRLDRDRSERNTAWDDCQRGTIIRIESSQRKEGSRLERIPGKGTVEILRRV